MHELLEKLKVPRSVTDLAHLLGYSEGSVRHMLRILKRKGYAVDVGCNSACRVCSLKNLCTAKDEGGEIWMITPEGKRLLKDAAAV